MNSGPFYYETRLHWDGRRRGISTSGTLPPIRICAPPEFGGEPGYWSPEHLLVASVESCLMEMFLSIAAKSELEIVSYNSAALARVEAPDQGGLRLARLVIRPQITVTSSEDLDRAERLLDRALDHCLVSNAVRDVQYQIEPTFSTA